MFNISTIWNIEKYEDAEDAINELNSLGFDGVELSWVNEKRCGQLKKLKVKTANVHAFLPEPEARKEGRWRGDVYRMTSANEQERKAAVAYFKKSVDNAAEFNSPAVVVHFGIPEGMFFDSSDLGKVVLRKGLKSKEYLQMKNTILKEREAKKIINMEAGLKSLDELNSYAVKRKIKIALENRMAYEELPGISEYKLIFSKFKGGCFYYWHDIGHEIYQKKIGFNENTDFYDTFKGQLIGMHVHDIVGLSDHHAPGKGCVDFTKYIESFKDKNIIKVFEVHGERDGIVNTKEEIIKAREMLEGMCI